jgi:hypothetical protein
MSSKPFRDNTYICDECKGEFEYESDWSEEDALKEKENNFGNIPIENCGIVCDDCYNKIMQHINN